MSINGYLHRKQFITHALILFYIILSSTSCKSALDLNNNNLMSEKIIDLEKEAELYTPTVYSFTVEQRFRDKPEVSGIYTVDFVITIILANYTNKNIISYRITDGDNTVLIEENEQRLLPDKDGGFIIKKIINSPFIIDKFRLESTIKSNDKLIHDDKEFTLSNIPTISNVIFGPVASQVFSGKINTSVMISISIENAENLNNIRLIPPGHEYYWDIPYIVTDNRVYAEGAVTSDKESSSLPNGEYLIQLNFEKYGIIQRELLLIDLFGNSSGKNYGFPIIFLKTSTRDRIEFDIRYEDTIEKIDLTLYDTDKTLIGSFTLDKPISIFEKKHLRELFKNEKGKKVKLKLNQKYLLKVILKTRKINNIDYLSISDYLPVVFEGFRLF